ncbi:CAP domain-containing protein [Bosea sp. (in: a-proteobacteria)]|uniref:CAP domain-containing protein n=1 Tax=Bosea sp. (in: a-proteobacteria) TaxID=1871050 RepID=UPI002FC5FA62
MADLSSRPARARPMSCPAALAGALALFNIAGCTEPVRTQPAFYRDLGSPSARVDAEAARATISAYRLNAGLATLRLDPALMQAAEQEAAAMAAADKPAQADAVKARLARDGQPDADANLSAGYRRLAEAFSGWRDSPQHDRVMRAPKATRMGIASAYAPGSKYQVYWALIMAP